MTNSVFWEEPIFKKTYRLFKEKGELFLELPEPVFVDFFKKTIKSNKIVPITFIVFLDKFLIEGNRLEDWFEFKPFPELNLFLFLDRDFFIQSYRSFQDWLPELSMTPPEEKSQEIKDFIKK